MVSKHGGAPPTPPELRKGPFVMSEPREPVGLLSVTLHYAPLRDSFGKALCGMEAPAGGWFGEKNSDLTARAKAAGAPVCPKCKRVYEGLPVGTSGS